LNKMITKMVAATSVEHMKLKSSLYMSWRHTREWRYSFTHS